MRSKGFRIAVIVFVGIIVVLGSVVAVTTGDQTMQISVALLAVLYIFYLAKVIPMLIAEKRAERKRHSPLERR